MKELYPFTGKTFLAGGPRLHYLDEGQGEPVVMVHGNPTWSFYYRDLVLGLRDRYRCVVPDHIGCGRSDKPTLGDYPYTLERRIDDLEGLIDSCRFDAPLTLVVHDWGGMIGMAYACRHPQRIARLVILNTSAFHIPGAKRLPMSLKLARTPGVGSLLVRGFNVFSRGAVRHCVTRPLSAEVRDAYLAPHRTWADRVSVHRFVVDIPIAPEDPGYDIVSEVQEKLALFRDTPTRIFWGARDFVFDDSFLAEWRRHLPEAEVRVFDDAGHFVLEDAGEEIIPSVRDFLETHPLEPVT